jgi:hypothetical protein
MLSARLIAVAAAFALVACHRLTSDERTLIGTWESHSMDATWRTTFNPDHTCSTVFEVDGRFDDSMPGTWRLGGSQLITEILFSNKEAPLQERTTPHILTEKITFVSHDKIESSVNYPYIRVK